MNLVEKDKFINDVIEDLRQEVKKRTDRMPEDWDGHEIRQFIADYYTSNFIFGTALTGKRKKDYKNTCLVDNLL